MGKIENQVLKRHREYVECLEWYAKSINKLQSDHALAVNDLNRAFNERMAEIKSMPKGNVNTNAKQKKKRTV